MKPGDEPAYPVKRKTPASYIENIVPDQQLEGITIRQQYVKAAMQGILANPRFNLNMNDEWNNLPNLAIEIADACLKREAETREK